MAAGILALIEGKPAPKDAANSLWAALNQPASLDLDRPALLSPRQSANTLSELVQPWPRGAEQDSDRGSSIGSGDVMRTLKKITSPACIFSYLLSWILPIPASNANYLRWSFAELERATIRLSSVLRGRGVKPGATAVFFTPVSAEWALLLSVSALNRYTAATLPNSALTPRNHVLQEQIDTLAPSLIVVTTQEEALHIACNIKANITVGISLERFTGPAPDGWMSMPDIAAEAVLQAAEYTDPTTSLPDDNNENPDRTAFVVYTSGSTGIPKGCPLSAGYLLSALGYLKQRLPFLPAPITLVSGVSFQTRCQALTIMSWATGNAAVIDAGESSAETILAALMTCRPVSLSLLVTTVRSIARAPNYSADAIKSVRFVDLVGSTVTMAILRTAQLTFPGARILPTFAMTEAAGTVTWATWHRPPSVHKMPAWHGIASSGTVGPGAALKVVDADKKVARRGDVGALHLRGNSVISSYLGGTSRPDAFYTGDDGHHWFVSGDDAVIDKQGFLYVLGRSQYTLKRDDEVIIPCTIEDFLETQFQDTTAAVVNITTSSGETGLYAVVEYCISATSPTGVKELVAQKLGHAYRIEGAASLGDIGFQKWPLTVGGKVAYHDLRSAIEMYLASGSVES